MDLHTDMDTGEASKRAEKLHLKKSRETAIKMASMFAGLGMKEDMERHLHKVRKDSSTLGLQFPKDIENEILEEYSRVATEKTRKKSFPYEEWLADATVENYETSIEGNQVKIENNPEKNNRRIISYNRSYYRASDFLKPTPWELKILGYAGVFSAGILYSALQYKVDPIVSGLASLLPQAIFYAGFRLKEHFLRDENEIKELRAKKVPFPPYSRVIVDRVVPLEKRL